ncbi:hypothetical protein N431DRAFT_553119, partial [Stipitochalara longipes BDJ]
MPNPSRYSPLQPLSHQSKMVSNEIEGSLPHRPRLLEPSATTADALNAESEPVPSCAIVEGSSVQVKEDPLLSKEPIVPTTPHTEADSPQADTIKPRSLEELLAENKQLKEELRLSRPLAEVGAAVRHHYLMQARKDIGTWYPRALSTAGEANAKLAFFSATCQPNAKADLALYQCGFLDANSLTDTNKFVEPY